jgi:uncharacterized membrane protein YvlD (DUF360 family)
LFYVVAAPVMMALVALIGGDKFATIGGVIAIVIGPIVYGIVRGGMVRRRGVSGSGRDPGLPPTS